MVEYRLKMLEEKIVKLQDKVRALEERLVLPKGPNWEQRFKHDQQIKREMSDAALQGLPRGHPDK